MFYQQVFVYCQVIINAGREICLVSFGNTFRNLRPLESLQPQVLLYHTDSLLLRPLPVAVQREVQRSARCSQGL